MSPGDDLDGMKGGLLAAQGLLVVTTNDQGHGMEPSEGFAMGVALKRGAKSVRVTTPELAAGYVALIAGWLILRSLEISPGIPCT
jgi:hypothetical protein